MESNKEFAGFHIAARNGILAFPYCSDCEKFHWYPMKVCPHCRSSTVEWKRVSGQGELYSWTVVRHPFSTDWESAVPYVVALVTFPDAPGVRFVTNLLQSDLDDLAIGASVVPDFSKSADEGNLVFFRVVKINGEALD